MVVEPPGLNHTRKRKTSKENLKREDINSKRDLTSLTKKKKENLTTEGIS